MCVDPLGYTIVLENTLLGYYYYYFIKIFHCKLYDLTESLQISVTCENYCTFVSHLHVYEMRLALSFLSIDSINYSISFVFFQPNSFRLM